MRAGAFFDLGHTLISRATPLALAATFHRRGLIRRRDIVRAVGFEGAVGSTCEIIDGVYTGKALQACYGRYKARARRELAERERIELARSTAYSDSHTDLAFLEAVGKPVAVNPDKKLRAIARTREWPVLTFRKPPRPVRGGSGRRVRCGARTD